MDATPSPSIWISSDGWHADEWDPRCDAIDVVVTLPEGTRWAATFLTPSYMEKVRREEAESGESLGGMYFWIARPIFTDELSRPAIEEIVRDLWENGELRTAFRRLPGQVVDAPPRGMHPAGP